MKRGCGGANKSSFSPQVFLTTFVNGTTREKLCHSVLFGQGWLFKSCLDKRQAGCRCINTGSCSVCRCSVQKHGSLKSASNEPLRPKEVASKTELQTWQTGSRLSRVKNPGAKRWLKKKEMYYTEHTKNSSRYLYVPCVPAQASQRTSRVWPNHLLHLAWKIAGIQKTVSIASAVAVTKGRSFPVASSWKQMNRFIDTLTTLFIASLRSLQKKSSLQMWQPETTSYDIQRDNHRFPESLSRFLDVVSFQGCIRHCRFHALMGTMLQASPMIYLSLASLAAFEVQFE